MSEPTPSDAHTWTVRVDRRQGEPTAIMLMLQELERSIEGLRLDPVETQAFWSMPDAGTFRDFTPVATLHHAHPQALEYVAELLLERFGWRVDLLPRHYLDPPPEDHDD